jgi:hypothetical protein
MTKEQQELFKQFLESREYYTVSEVIANKTSLHVIRFFDQETDEEICSINTFTFKDKKTHEFNSFGKIDESKFKKAKKLANGGLVTQENLDAVE